MRKCILATIMTLFAVSAIQAEDSYRFSDNGWRIQSRHGNVEEDRGFTVEGKGDFASKARKDAKDRLKQSAKDHARAVNRTGEGGHYAYPTVVYVPRPVYVPVYRPVYWP